MRSLVGEKIMAITTHRATGFALIAFIFASLISYVYFANIAVRTLTVLEKSKEEVQTLSVKVSEMEARRLLVDNSVSNALATHLGFVEVKDQTFIVNKSNKTAFSLQIN